MANLPFGASASPFGALSPTQNVLDLLTSILRQEAAKKALKDQSRIAPEAPKDQSRIVPEGAGLPGLEQRITMEQDRAYRRSLNRPDLPFQGGGTAMAGLPGGGGATGAALLAPQIGQLPSELPMMPPMAPVGPSITPPAPLPGALPSPGAMPPQIGQLPSELPSFPSSAMGQPMQGGQESGYVKSALMMIQAAINPDKVAPIADAAGLPVPDLKQLGGPGAPPGLGGPAAALESPFLPSDGVVGSGDGGLSVGAPQKDQSRIAAEALDPHGNSPLLQSLLPGVSPFGKDPSRIAATDTPQLPLPLMPPGMEDGQQPPLPFRSGVPDDPLLPDALIPSMITGGPETPGGAGPPIDLAAPLSPSTAVPTAAQSPIASLMKALSGVKMDPNATRRIPPPGSAGVVLPKDYTDFTQLLMALMQAEQGPKLGPLLGGGGY